MNDIILHLKNAFFSLSVTTQFVIFFIGFLIVVFIFFLIGKLSGQLEAEHKFKNLLKDGRLDAIKRSKAVLNGQMVEQIAPFLPNFPCNPADVRFVGKPIDFVAFPGASENKEIKEVVFIEVKTGNSVLSPREKEIKEAIQQGRVRYVEYRFDESSGTC